MKIDCTSNNGKPCLNCEAYMAGFRAGTLSANGAELNRAVTTFARLRNLCGEAADMLDSMPWRPSVVDLRERLLEAVANK